VADDTGNPATRWFVVGNALPHGPP